MRVTTYIRIRGLAAALALVMAAAISTASAGNLPPDFDKNHYKYLSLGIDLRDGKGTPSDPALGVKYLRALAERGEPLAQFHLGIAYEKGLGTEKNLEEALYWYKQAGDKQYMSHVAVRVGDMYSNGLGTPVDYSQAVYWYEFALSKQDSEAYLRMAEAYLDGKGVEQDTVKGMDLLHEAIKRKAIGAQARLQTINRAKELDQLGLDSVKLCTDIPKQYTDYAFGRPLYGMLNMCRLRDMTSNEVLYLAGMAERMLEECHLPENLNQRSQLRTLIISSSLVLSIGRQSNNNPLLAVGDMAAANNAFKAGLLEARQVSCEKLGPVTNALVKFLELDGISDPAHPSFVQGCVATHKGRYSEKQCRCAADIGRVINPQIYRYFYDDQTIKALLSANPMIGVQIATQCGISY